MSHPTPAGPPPQPSQGAFPQQETYGAPYAAPGCAPSAAQNPPLYAAWWQRAQAYLLDCLINFGPMWLLIGASWFIDENSSGDSGEAPASIVSWVGIIVMLVTAGVQLVREGRTGQSVGKKVLKIRVIRAYDGLVPGIGLAFARRIFQFLNYAAFCLGWLWAIRDPKKQTFADAITGVVVVPADATSPRQFTPEGW